MNKLGYIKWQTLAIGVPIGIFFLIAGLLNLAGMEYTIPPDIICNDCYSQIQVNSSVWEIKVEHAGPLKDAVFKKVSRSRTLWVNLDKINMFVDTEPSVPVEILVPTIKKYSTIKHPEFGYLRPIKDGDKLVERKNKYNPDGDRFIIHGITSGQTVKWGLGIEHYLMEDIEFDPLWLGTTEGERLWYNSPTPYANESYRIEEFINVSGTNFTLAGAPYKFIGTDSYYITDYATNLTYDDDGNQITNSRQYAIELLNEMQFLNINVFRTWVGIQCGGRPGSNSSTWQINESGGHYNCFENNVPGNFNETMFEALDWVIYEASKRDIRVMPVLVNNWNDYGGMRWYVHHSPDTDKTYENITSSADNNYWKFHDQFYNDTQSVIWFQNFTNYTLHRNNTISGILYKDDPTIFAWLLANEPRAHIDPLGIEGLIKNWTINMTSFIKTYDTNHLVGLGMEGWGYNETWGEGTNFIDNHNGTGVDFTTYALHPDEWEYFLLRGEGPTDNYWMNETFNQTSIDWWTNGTGLSWNNKDHATVTDYAPDLGRHGYQDWVRQHVNWSNQLDMPIILQEVGVKTFHKEEDKDIFYKQAIHNFYETGGDGMLLWTLNHDEYYYSTATDGDMDDGFGFYVSDDTFLHNKSLSAISAFNFSMFGDGGESWINILNSFKYDFVLNTDIAGIHNQSDISSYAVGNWRFERDSAGDYSGNENNGTLVNDIANTTGIVGYGYEFDGDEDKINIPIVSNHNFTSNFTVLLWIKPISSLISGTVIEKAVGTTTASFVLYQTFSGGLDKLNWYATVGGAWSVPGATYSPLALNEWIQVGFHYNDSGGQMIINGQFYGARDSPGGVYPFADSGDIGIGGIFTGIEFNGTIDEVLIFNRSLSSGEISGIYNDSLKTQPALAHVINNSIYLNTYNGTSWSGWSLNQSNTTGITNDVDYTFITQFGTDIEQFKWYAQVCDNYDLCLNGSIATVDLGTDPTITLLNPLNDSYYRWSPTELDLEYSVTGSLDVGNCQLFINNVLNETDSTITKDTSQYFTKNISSIPSDYIWRVECTDTGDRTGVSANQTFYTDIINPNINFTAPTLANNSETNQPIFINYSTNDTSDIYSFIKLDNSLVGWWKFENDSAKDYSGHDNDGSITSEGPDDITNTTGRFGYAYKFDGDGAGNCISMGDPGDGSLDFGYGSFSISVWWKSEPMGPTDNYCLVCKGASFNTNGDGYSIRILTGIGFWNGINDGDGAVVSDIEYFGNVDDGEWHHAGWVINRSSNLSTLYVDGSQLGTDTDISAAQNIDSVSNLFVGCWVSATYYNMNGTIDEILIFNRTLSAEEITALYNSTLTYNNFADISDGNHTFTSYVVDRAGNMNQTEELSLYSDKLAPTISLWLPENKTRQNIQYVNFTYSVTDVSSISMCQLYLDTTGTLETINSTDSSIEKGVNQTFNLSLEDGEFYWKVECNDTLNNYGNSSIYTLIVDTTYPQIIYTDPTPGNNTNRSYDSIYVNYSTSDLNDIYSFIDFDSSLVGWWRFEEDSVDESGEGNDGTVTGAVNTTAGRFGYAYEFYGGGDSVNIGGADEFNFEHGNFTISAWINYRESGKTYVIVSKDGDDKWGGKGTNSFDFYLLSSNDIKFGGSVADGYCNVGTAGGLHGLSPNQWNHVVARRETLNSTTFNFSIWTNGELLVDSEEYYNSTLCNISNTQDVYIGRPSYTSALSFNGTIDEVLVFNRSLSAEEIVALYNSSASQTYRNFTGLSERTYDFKAYVVDETGNKNQTFERSILIDATNPVVTLVYPSNDTWLPSINMSFTYNVTDDNNLANCSLLLVNNRTYVINSTDFGISKDVNQTFNITIDQCHTRWKIICTDSSLNQGSSIERIMWNWSIGLTNATDFNIDYNTWYTNNSIAIEGQNSTQGGLSIYCHAGAQTGLYVGVNESIPTGINITLDTDNSISGGVNLTTTLQFLKYIGDVEAWPQYVWAWVGLENVTLGMYQPGIEFETRVI